MQFGPPPVAGIIYNTTLSRPDAALSLALLYGLEGKREARVASVAVTHAGFASAVFADAVFRFYQLGPPPNSNRTLPVGYAIQNPAVPDAPFVKAILDRTDDKGEPVFKRGVRRVTDTAEVTALMRNSLAYFPDGKVVVLLSAPATYLARVLDYAGTRDLITSKVRTLIVSECAQDAPAMRRVLAEWPTPVAFCGADIGEAALYPAESIEKDFAWTQAHPVVEFYRGARAMPYDEPAQDLAAILYAARPESGLLQASDTGVIEVSDSGSLRFALNPEGKHKRLSITPGKHDDFVKTVRELVSAKPVPPPQRRRFTQEELEKLRKEREEEQRKRELEERKAGKPTP